MMVALSKAYGWIAVKKTFLSWRIKATLNKHASRQLHTTG
jgi:hypothetical protein